MVGLSFRREAVIICHRVHNQSAGQNEKTGYKSGYGSPLW